MLNQVVLVGRIVDKPIIIKTEDGKDNSQLILAVQRCAKNIEGIYETDYITCLLQGSIATNVNEYCKKGDIVGIKGRIYTTRNENEDGSYKYIQDIIAEKVTFLTSKSDNNE